MRSAFNDDFKRQQNPALLQDPGRVKPVRAKEKEPVQMFGNRITVQQQKQLYFIELPSSDHIHMPSHN